MTRRLISVLVVSLGLIGCQEKEAAQFSAVLPLTGPQSIYGQSIQMGLEVALEDLNAAGAVPQGIQLTVLDSESDPAKASQLAEQQYGEGALAIVGGVTTREALQMVPIADERDRIVVLAQQVY